MVSNATTQTPSNAPGCASMGDKLRAMRRHLGLSQDALALSASLSKSTIEAIERNKAQPKPNTMDAIAGALGADPLIFTEDNPIQVIAMSLIAPLEPGDLIPLFETATRADVVTPTSSDLAIAARIRDVCRFFGQLVDIYRETPPPDAAVYLRDLLDLSATLRAAGWVVRTGFYDQQRVADGADAPVVTIGVLRIRPVRRDGDGVFLTAPPDATITRASPIKVLSGDS